MEARAKRNARHAARRVRGEEEFLVDFSIDSGGDADMDVYELHEVRVAEVEGNTDEEGGVCDASAAKAATVIDGAGGSGSGVEGEKPKRDEKG